MPNALSPATTPFPPSFWPVRRYPWGTCEALRSTHSDLTCLKKLLFEVGYEELKGETERRYYGFRKEQLLQGRGKGGGSRGRRKGEGRHEGVWGRLADHWCNVRDCSCKLVLRQ